MAHVKHWATCSADAGVLLLLLLLPFTSQFAAEQRVTNARLANKFSSYLGYQLTW
ncbi:MAG TPA: hypothetical protein PK372_10495 [Rugosibacter sp.]|nr:hypothetical protein [Rugosibacter sp.]HQQ36339.1 hypothetical protein [Rugosibacter sp.]